MIATVYRLDCAACKKLGLKDAYGVHKAVYSLFPKREGENRDFLYADKGGDLRGRTILVVSNRPPDQPEVGSIATKNIPERFLEHDRYAFEIVLNPSRRDSKSEKTVAVLGRENLRQWILEKVPHWGFQVDADTLEIRHAGLLRYMKNGTLCSHNTATFVGKLTVTDREKFKASFQQGIGRAKSFGFGLLQIIPLSESPATTV